jgi:integrase
VASVNKREWTYKGEKKTAWVVRYTDQGGTRRMKTFEKKKDADGFRVQVEGEITHGVHTAYNESVTFSKAVDEFVKDCYRRQKLGDLTMGGVKGYEYRLEHYTLPKFATRRVSSLTASEVQAYIEELREKLSPSTISGIYGSLHVLLTFAVSKKWVRRNVLRDEPCKLPPTPKRKAIPTKDDIRALLEAAARLDKGENLQTFINRSVVIACGVFCGFRPGETFGLHWEDINWEKGVIHVRRAYSHVNGLKQPKTEAGNRDVPLTEPVRRALYQAARYRTICGMATEPRRERGSTHPKAINSRIYRMWETEVVHVDPTQLRGFVVLTRIGKPMTATASATTFWKRLMDAAGLYDHEAKRNKFTPHALRHVAASLLIEAGLDDMNLKRFIGHASIQTTKDIYGHLFPTDQRMVATTEAVAASLDATRPRQIAVRHSFNS